MKAAGRGSPWFSLALLLVGLLVLVGCASATPAAQVPPPLGDAVGVETVADEGTGARDAATASPVLHSVAGPRANCLACHVVGRGRKPLPADHAGWGVETCLTCHLPAASAGGS